MVLKSPWRNPAEFTAAEHSNVLDTAIKHVTTENQRINKYNESNSNLYSNVKVTAVVFRETVRFILALYTGAPFG